MYCLSQEQQAAQSFNQINIHMGREEIPASFLCFFKEAYHLWNLYLYSKRNFSFNFGYDFNDHFQFIHL